MQAPVEPWRRYPFALVEGDPELVFPAAEGDQGHESNTYYVAGRLADEHGEARWAFLTVFAFNDVRHRIRADFHTFALFDLRTGDYGTFSEHDLPRPLVWRRRYKLTVAEGHLDVAFESAHGRSAWTTVREPGGGLRPFTYRLDLHGLDGRGRHMHLALDVDTLAPPAPVGGAAAGGVKTCMGQYGTHSYFQSDVRFRGRLGWGDVAADVVGDAGWIDRQWTPRYLGVHSDRRNTGYRHEWRQIHLDDGVAMSVWLHVDRHRHDRMIPFAGATATWPDGTVRATSDFVVDRTSFVRDPGVVRPRYRLTAGGQYMADRYRLRIPAWELDLTARPLVPAPAHAFPIEYWSGPTEIEGTREGRAVRGFGFHERTFVFARDFELVDVLRATLHHLPAAALGGEDGRALGDLAWEVDAFLSHGDRAAAADHLRRRLAPRLAGLERTAREHVLGIVADLDAALRA
jgi:hypothetical protein